MIIPDKPYYYPVVVSCHSPGVRMWEGRLVRWVPRTCFLLLHMWRGARIVGRSESLDNLSKLAETELRD